MNDELMKIKDAIIKAVAVEKLYLFGSHANGNPHNDSDYDLYMVIPNDDIRPIDALGEAHLAMCGLEAGPVDILAGTVEIFNRRSKQLTMERKIANEGVVIYERA